MTNPTITVIRPTSPPEPSEYAETAPSSVPPSRFPLYRAPYIPPTSRESRVHSVIDGMPCDFRPTLQPNEELTESQTVNSIIARAGLANPPLPTLMALLASTSAAPSALRTTAQGIRLEITPAAMLLRTHPEDEIPSNTPEPSVSSQSPNRSSGNPELDPEC